MKDKIDAIILFIVFSVSMILIGSKHPSAGICGLVMCFTYFVFLMIPKFLRLEK